MAYAARTAWALGCRVGVITSVAADVDLDALLGDIRVRHLPASTSTTFENIYTESGRQQVVHGVAHPLKLGEVPTDWRARLVHIGPVARECDPTLVSAFEDAFVGVTPQGWMRQWDSAGYVSRRRWEEAGQVLPHADAVVLSEEDVGSDRFLVAEYARQTPCLALTQGAAGCTVFAYGDVRHFPAPNVTEVDSTGAGDVFAACLFYALQQGYEAWIAARFANCIAAQSVTRLGLFATPHEEEVSNCRGATLRDVRDNDHHLRAG